MQNMAIYRFTRRTRFQEIIVINKKLHSVSLTKCIFLYWPFEIWKFESEHSISGLVRSLNVIIESDLLVFVVRIVLDPLYPYMKISGRRERPPAFIGPANAQFWTGTPENFHPESLPGGIQKCSVELYGFQRSCLKRAGCQDDAVVIFLGMEDGKSATLFLFLGLAFYSAVGFEDLGRRVTNSVWYETCGIYFVKKERE